MQAAVDRLRHERGKTRIDKALETASRDVFPYARKGVHQIAMVITDGEQTQEADTKDLKVVSEPLRRAGVQVLALGIGKSVNPDELRLMVERDEDVLLAKSFQDLLVKVNSLIKSICDATGKILLELSLEIRISLEILNACSFGGCKISPCFLTFLNEIKKVYFI